MTAPVTVETLTAETIRELHDTAVRDRDFALKSDCVFAVFPDARVPHGHEARYARDKIAARQRICDAINAREAKPCTCPPMWPLEHVGRHHPKCPSREAKLAANREDEPCPDDECKHVYDNWPAGSVTERDRSYDQCPACGWTETEVSERNARREAGRG